MSMKQVEFTIGGGKVEIEASGFKGGACDAATKAFEEILGGNVSNKKKKAEYYQAATTNTQSIGKGGNA